MPNKKNFIKKSIIIFALLKLSACSSSEAADQTLKIEQTPERIARGKYLAEHVSDCMSCHSTTTDKYFARPVVEGTEGKGGLLFGHENGFPGELYTRNITPYALKDWSDGEIVRAITQGRSKDGHALFPIMPYTFYGKMSQEDIYSIVAYIRTLKPVESTIPDRKLDFPLNMIVNFMPKKADFHEIPDKKDTVKYGEYLTNAAGCIVCHTQTEKGKMIEGKEFAGGEKFILSKDVVVYSANITPDKKTGIGNWTRDAFINRFKAYDNPQAKSIPVEKGKVNTIMPWLPLSGMTREDLGAIYDYIHTLKPIENKVSMTEGIKQ